MLNAHVTIPLYRLTQHECPTTVRAFSDRSRILLGKFARAFSRDSLCLNAQRAETSTPQEPAATTAANRIPWARVTHAIELQIDALGHESGGVHVLRRNHWLCGSRRLQLGLHCPRCPYARSLKAPTRTIREILQTAHRHTFGSLGKVISLSGTNSNPRAR
jgi:hypothetical protein